MSTKTLPGTNTFAQFGGTKVDYSQVTDSTTDWSADQISSMAAATAQMTRTAVRGMVRFVAGGSPVLATSNSYESVWRADTLTVPVIANTGTGIFTVTLPSVVNDPQGNPINLNLTSCQVTLEGSILGVVNASVTAANTITVYTGNSSMVANNLTTGTTVCVWFTGK
jgi:hypothetical protein